MRARVCVCRCRLAPLDAYGRGRPDTERILPRPNLRKRQAQQSILQPGEKYMPLLQLKYVLKRDSANDITITQMFITLAIMLEVY